MTLISLIDLTAAIMALGLIAYAVFGGADFGGGVWTALSTGPRSRHSQEAIFQAMGPVWETNHVWLIFVVVVLFTAFPAGFALIFIALLAPLVIALVGIVFRGAAFGFRHFGGDGLPATGLVFSAASLISPLALGMALGALSSGDITVENGEVTSGVWFPWLQPLPVMFGLTGVSICGFLTAHFMTTRSSGELQEDFRKRSITSSIILGLLAISTLPVAAWDAPLFWQELTRAPALVAIGLAAASGVATSVVVWRRWYLLAPPAAACTVALIFAGWLVAQYPYLILPTVELTRVAAGESALRALLISLPIGAALLIPSLALLYRIFSGPVETQEH